MEGFQQYGDSEIAKVTQFAHQRCGHALNSHLGILQPEFSSKPYILLNRNLMKGFLHNGGSEIAKSSHSLIKYDHVLNSHIGDLYPPSPSKPYILLSKNLKKSSDIMDNSEIAKKPIWFTHQRCPCTKEPSWNISTNIFQIIYSLEKKLDWRLPLIWRLRNS